MIIRGNSRSPVPLLHRDNIDVRVTPTIMSGIGGGRSVESPVVQLKPLFGVWLGEFDRHDVKCLSGKVCELAVLSAKIVWL